MKSRVLFVLDGYPCLSQTYKENEIKYTSLAFEVRVASFGFTPARYRSHQPYESVGSIDKLKRVIREFKPDIIHGHYLHNLPLLDKASQLAGGVPFTVRTHSYDLIGVPVDRVQQHASYSRTSRCRGVICFPFLHDLLVRCGIDEALVIDDFPVVDFQRFYDRRNDSQKDIASYVRLASIVRSRQFTYCPVGHNRPCENDVLALNAALRNPVQFIPNVEPYEMPILYKSCEWLVYTASSSSQTVGWPMAIAEAQASGCGVLIQNIRRDIQDYVGGAGFVFDELEEAAEILSQPYPSELRELGFKLARRSDIAVNIAKLFNAWGKG